MYQLRANLMSLPILFQKYILPAWVGASEEQKSLKEMKKSVSDLEKTVKLLIEGMKKVEGTLTDQENNVRQMVNSAAQERVRTAIWWYWWSYHCLALSCQFHCTAVPACITEHIEAETKWTTFCRQHFQTCFLHRKCLNFDWNFTEVCF